MNKRTFAHSLMGVAFAAALATPASASIFSNYTFPDSLPGFALNTSNSILNGILIGFTPPNPSVPQNPFMLFDDPANPVLVSPGPCLCSFEMSFLGSALPAVQYPPQPIFNPDGNVNTTGFSFTAGDHLFQVAFSISGPGAVTTWAAFNPQPDPPADFFAGQVGFANAEDPQISFNIFDNGTPIQFSPAATPLPAAFPLFATGLGVMGWLSRRRKQKASATALTTA
jgi:hypothetical protein